MRLTLPMPPSVNRLWRQGRGGRVYKTDAARVFAWEVAAAAQHAGVQLLTGDVAVSMWVYVARKNADTDNFCKCTLDALQGLAYENDKQVVELHLYKRYANKKTARIEVEISAT